MKNSFNKFATLLLALTLVFSFSSCEKEEIEPDNITNPTDVVANNDAVTTEYETPVTVSVLTNDTGIDISVLGVASNPSNGTISVNGNTITYTPDASFSGNDSFTYEISDLTGVSSVGTVTITVLPDNVVITNPTNTAPTINATVALTGSSTIDISSFTNDVDNDNITLVSITGVSNGTINQSGSTFSYTPTNALWVGTETLSVTVNDGTVTTTADVTLTYGTSAQIATYNLISPYLDNAFAIGSHVSSLRLNSDGTLTSYNKQVFYGATSAQSGSYIILENGNIRINAFNDGATFREFTITELNDVDRVGLTFTGYGETLHVWNLL